MSPTDLTLLRILGDTDATWIPVRSFAAPRPANTFLAQRDFGRVGLRFSHGEASEAGRKEAQRELEHLARLRLVRVSRMRRTRAHAVLLTDLAEDRARRLVGLPVLADAWRGVKGAFAEVPPGAWLSERSRLTRGHPVGSREESTEARELEDLLLPALVRRFVEANADCRGLVYYRLTTAGEAWLQGECPAAADQVAVDENAREIYFERVAERLAHLGSAAPSEPRENGFLPLPVSGPAVRPPAVAETPGT